MVSFAFRLIFSISLHFAKVGAFVMGSEVYSDLFIVASEFFFVLLDATFDDDIHVFISIAFFINLGASFILFERGVVEYLPPFF